eukprot:1840094-Amphidinium_carterae.1
MQRGLHGGEGGILRQTENSIETGSTEGQWQNVVNNIEHVVVTRRTKDYQEGSRQELQGKPHTPTLPTKDHTLIQKQTDIITSGTNFRDAGSVVLSDQAVRGALNMLFLSPDYDMRTLMINIDESSHASDLHRPSTTQCNPLHKCEISSGQPSFDFLLTFCRTFGCWAW